jgi:hypothetical protein
LRNSLSKPDDASHFDSINNRRRANKSEKLAKARNLHRLDAVFRRRFWLEVMKKNGKERKSGEKFFPCGSGVWKEFECILMRFHEMLV